MSEKLPSIHYYFEDLEVGMKASLTRTVTDETVRAFAVVSGDSNPVHLDSDFAAQTVFGERVAHGALIFSFVSALIGTQLPGPGVVLKEFSDLSFKNPVYIDDTVIVDVEVIKKLAEKKRSGDVILRAVVRTNTGERILSVDASVSVPRKPA